MLFIFTESSALKNLAGLLPENIIAALNIKFPTGRLPDIGWLLQEFSLPQVKHLISHTKQVPCFCPQNHILHNDEEAHPNRNYTQYFCSLQWFINDEGSSTSMSLSSSSGCQSRSRWSSDWIEIRLKIS